MKVFVASFGFFDNNPTRSVNALAQTQKPENSNPSALFTLIKQQFLNYGNETTPIMIFDFTDFQCPLCKRFVDNTESQINSIYIQTDKIAYTFNRLPNIC